ncbi:MAG: hypothetical protein IT459_19225 [Planctomycetes bacterium]|nr:hypothetical protein [Planctomycetota bacterium]
MALTLLESAKRMTGETHRQGIVEIFGQSTDLLRVLPFDVIQGNAYRYDQEGTLPGIAFRGVNESYTESTGIINPQVEHLVIAGGDVDVDKALMKWHGAERRAEQVAMKVKALGHTISHKLIKGDSTTDPREVDGLQRRITGTQLIPAGATSGGDALSLFLLDAAIDAVAGATHLLMSRAMRRRFTQAARNTTVGGNIQITTDALGRQIMKYADLEILFADADGDLYASLGFNEANPGGGSAVGTSIYILSLGTGKMKGIHSGPPDAADLGEQNSKPVFRTRVEWYPGMVIEHPRAAARLYGVKDAAIVA